MFVPGMAAMAGLGAEKKFSIELTGGITLTGLDWLSPNSPEATTAAQTNKPRRQRNTRRSPAAESALVRR